MIAAAAAVLLSLFITLGPILSASGGFDTHNTELKVAPRKGDLTVIPADFPIKPLVEDLGGRPTGNPFTGKMGAPPPSRLPPPPPPSLVLPLPPALPLPEK
jgi:hypothetical protein